MTVNFVYRFTNRINISGDNGSPCFNPIATLKKSEILLLLDSFTQDETWL